MENANYPFLKLTLDERFPRLLITRRPEKKTSEQNIYGAFLPIGMARRMLDLLQRVFRLRPCELDIRGDFESPCPEYFLHRCLAPCVEAICSRETYLESIEIVHLLLSNQTEPALKKIDRQIERHAENLEFERAAEWRDARRLIEEIRRNAKWQINVSEMNDVLTVNLQIDSIEILLTTLRRGKAVGKLNFQTFGNQSQEKIIVNFIEDFYKFCAPKQIFVSFDFPERKSLERKLRADFGRQIKIIAQPADQMPPSVSKTNALAAHSFKYKKGQTLAEKNGLLKELKQIFDLKKLPRRIECFDVAHLAGKEIVAARVRAIDGVLRRDDGLVWEFENLTETAALAAAVRERLRLLPARSDSPDLLMLDGGKPQISRVKKMLAECGLTNLTVIGAVKPPKFHNRISHFLMPDGSRAEFDKRSSASNFLQSLRDAAHSLANETHRELHSLAQIFRNNDSAPHVKYLLVPIRFAERGGEAEDLSPIRSLTQAGEVILKTKGKRPEIDLPSGSFEPNS